MLECSFLSILLLVRLKLSGVPFKFLGKYLALPVNIRKGSKDLTLTNTIAYFNSLSVTNKNFFISLTRRRKIFFSILKKSICCWQAFPPRYNIGR